MERFAQLSGAKLLFVPYKGSAPAIIAVMGGEIHMAAASSIAATGAIRTGKVRALATLGLTRIPSMPDLPTVAEQGFPGFKITNRYRSTRRRERRAPSSWRSIAWSATECIPRRWCSGSKPTAPARRAHDARAAQGDNGARLAEIEQQVKELGIKPQ